MMGMKKASPVLLALLTLQGCFTPRSWIDPGMPIVTRHEVSGRSAQELKLKLEVDFLRNDQPYPQATGYVRQHATAILRSTGWIEVTGTDADGVFTLHLNNIANIHQAVSQGISTGLTFGALGNTVIDGYEATVTITLPGFRATVDGLHHSIYSLVGAGRVPAGIESSSLDDAFHKALEQIILRALRDIELPSQEIQVSAPTRQEWTDYLRGEVISWSFRT